MNPGSGDAGDSAGPLDLSDLSDLCITSATHVRTDTRPRWILENLMGPHPLWLLESLTEVMPIESGMRILDLGCGKALTSIFLAKEFGARVWATDLWIDATSNARRDPSEAGVEDLVTPIHSEAHALPFADGFFDAVVSIDAYQYFGTADLYIGYITRFLRDEGRIGIVVPSLATETRRRDPGPPRPVLGMGLLLFPLARVVANTVAEIAEGERRTRRLDRRRLEGLATFR